MKKFSLVSTMLVALLVATPLFAHGIGPQIELIGAVTEHEDVDDWNTDPLLLLVGITYAHGKTHKYTYRVGAGPFSEAERGFVLEGGVDISLSKTLDAYLGVGYLDREPIDGPFRLRRRPCPDDLFAQPCTVLVLEQDTIDDDGPVYLRTGLRGEIGSVSHAVYQWGVGVRVSDGGTDRGDVAPWVSFAIVTK